MIFPATRTLVVDLAVSTVMQVLWGDSLEKRPMIGAITYMQK